MRLIAAGLVLVAAVARGAEPVGEWLGVLGGTDHIVLNVSKSGAGANVVTVRNLQQTGRPLQADRVEMSNGHLVATFSPLNGTYEGQWDAAKSTWTGVWRQRAQPDRPLDFAPTTAAEYARFVMHRPQEEAIDRGPLPYKNENVRFENPRAHLELAGTFSTPQGKGPFPAILLIAGAGPMDRDEGIGHRFFLVHADNLLRRGIAVLRYDKRGVRESAGDFSTATFDDLVSDARAAFAYLQARPEVDKKRLGVLGHSEGGSIAPAVAVNDKAVSFLVLMAGSGLRGDVRTTEQSAMRAIENGASPEQAAKVKALWQQLFATFRAAPDDATANTRLAKLIDAAAASAVITAEQAGALRNSVNAAALREMIKDDPVVYMRQVAARVPTLALIGSKDLVVLPEPWLAVMRPLLKVNPRSSVVELPDHNHGFQRSTTGYLREINTIEESASPLVLQTIGDWVVKQTK
jgi:pimeloyl-ACP methyl ester carboxylesterase